MASVSNLQETTVRPHLPGSKLWRCTLCNRDMQDISKANHLAGKAHARVLKSGGLSSLIGPSHHAVVPLQQKASLSRASFLPSSPTTVTDGPLDNFFHSYPSFHYKASTPPATSFNSLRNHLAERHRWPRDSSERNELWERYQDALTQEFNR